MQMARIMARNAAGLTAIITITVQGPHFYTITLHLGSDSLMHPPLKSWQAATEAAARGIGNTFYQELKAEYQMQRLH